MLNETWSTFPTQLERKINDLLEEALPTPMKAFHLYKTCQRENLWNESYEKFVSSLDTFFSLPRLERRKSVLDNFLDRPLSMATYEEFHLDFHCAVVNQGSLHKVASWAHFTIRTQRKSDSVVISDDVLAKTLQNITRPPAHEKAENITFEDFCEAWKKVVFRLFGRKYDPEFDEILKELRWLRTLPENPENTLPEEPRFVPTIYLTQTEIDWTTAVQMAVLDNLAVPRYPLSKGPTKQRLIDLKRTISLYNIVRTTTSPEFLKHRDSIRATILSLCDKLLKERAR